MHYLKTLPDLVTKLESFEEIELAKVQDQIAAKGAAVVEVLRSHMDREMRSGNLDTALALKEKITSVLAMKPSDEERPSSPSKDEGSDMTEEFFVGPV